MTKSHIDSLKEWSQMGSVYEESDSLLVPIQSSSEAVERTGTLWSSIAHIITAVIGAGVLSLAWSTAQLGWIGGPVSLLFFAVITYISAFLLADCYRSNDSGDGVRFSTYVDAVRHNLGETQTWFCGFLQYTSFYGSAVAYVITTSTSMRAIQKSNCYHKEGHEANCAYGDTKYMLLFGIVQVFVSQIPDFHNMEWLSIVAAIMSFTYSFIGFGLAIAQVIENGKFKGSITGVSTSSFTDKLFRSFEALADIAFAYPFSGILLQIQDTLKSPPPENKTIKKASLISVITTTFFYLSCGCFGYAAFGDSTPGNLLTGFGFYEPYWLIDFANACIVLHLVGGYQVFSQPVFAFIERWLTGKFPTSEFVNNFYTLKLPGLPPWKVNLMRLCFRTVYVASTTAISMLFPYFNQVLGVLGAINFWPLTIYFPVEMYLVQKKIQPWTMIWVVLRIFSFICFMVTIIGLVGSIEGTLWSCVAHIITAAIGAGVLSLAWSTAQLGWIAGPVALLCFATITYISAFLLVDCYRSNDSGNGVRFSTYVDAVRHNLGETQTWFCGLLQYMSFYGSAVAYVITTSTSMRAIQKSNCYHKEGHEAECAYGDTKYMLLFGVVQVFVSQIPDFHNMKWLSIVAAIMSFAYSFIGFGLAIAQVIENGKFKGSITGVSASSFTDKLFLTFEALGDIAFAYPFSRILLEIQDTLKSPPPENKTMKKASMISVSISTFLYLSCGCFGYAAFGDSTPGNLLTGFGFYEPYWLIDFANACIVLHLVGGYQVYSQQVFAVTEKWLAGKFPTSMFVNKFYMFKLPGLPPWKMNLMRICFRTVYVASTTAIAMLFPYFNQVLGVLGAFNFWPLTIYFPVEMYLVQKKIQPWTSIWVSLRTFSFICLILTIIGLVGSIEGIISAKLSS